MFITGIPGAQLDKIASSAVRPPAATP